MDALVNQTGLAQIDYTSWVHNSLPLWWRISLSIRVQTTLDHSLFVFSYNIDVKENCFFPERDHERDTLTRAAMSGLLYRQRQISRSDSKISSNFGKKLPGLY